ncbi:MAG: hypothetical protein ABI841_02885 [Chloroflexota bacterium]
MARELVEYVPLRMPDGARVQVDGGLLLDAACDWIGLGELTLHPEVVTAVALSIPDPDEREGSLMRALREACRHELGMEAGA